MTFKSVDELLQFINNFHGAGLLVIDNEELRQRLNELTFKPASEITGDDIAFEVKYKDLLAPGTISDWITRAQMESVNSRKLASAQSQLRIVTDFQAKHPDQCQMPD